MSHGISEGNLVFSPFYPLKTHFFWPKIRVKSRNFNEIKKVPGDNLEIPEVSTLGVSRRKTTADSQSHEEDANTNDDD